MLAFSSRGLYCPAADIYIDPSSRVERAIITHAHSDHARGGHRHYLAHPHTISMLKHRLGSRISAQSLEYGASVELNGVRISLHPAGHIIGSAQVRFEHRGEVWVASGDYKLENDGISKPFEPLRCTVFVTESTFGLPVYRWQEQKEIYDEINSWWMSNQRLGKVSVLACYALGKAQRVLGHLDTSLGPIFAHETIRAATHVVRDCGIPLPEPLGIPGTISRADVQGAFILAPPSVSGTPWLAQFRPYSFGYASGWMIGSRARRPGIDIGFALSDHADWDGLNVVVEATTAHRIFVGHGFATPFARWLREKGYDASEVDRQAYDMSTE